MTTRPGADQAVSIDTATRRAYELDLRRRGKPYREIARLTIEHFGADSLPKGYDERYAYMDLKRELAHLREEVHDAAEDVLELELERLDRMLDALWDQLEHDDLDNRLSAIDRLLKVGRRRAELLGLDAPVRTETEVKGEIKVDDHRNELQRKVAAIRSRTGTESMDSEPESG